MYSTYAVSRRLVFNTPFTNAELYKKVYANTFWSHTRLPLNVTSSLPTSTEKSIIVPLPLVASYLLIHHTPSNLRYHLPSHIDMKLQTVLLLTLLLMGSVTANSCQPNPFVHHFKFGNQTAAVLSDGPIIVPENPFISSDYAVFRSYRENFRSVPPFVFQQNVLLLDTEAGRILVDTGSLSGVNRNPIYSKGGRLFSNLLSLGISPDSIDIVLLTHGHLDHIGGLTREDGSVTFPNATVYTGMEEHEFLMLDEAPAFPNLPAEAVGKCGSYCWRALQQIRWQSLNTDTNLHFLLIHCAAGIQALYRSAISSYKASGRLRLVRENGRPFKGVQFIPAQGHSPGHNAIRFTSGDASLTVIGDAWLTKVCF